MPIVFANNVSTQLASGFNDTATTLVVTANDGSLFPVLGLNETYRITLENSSGELEVCQIVDRTTDTLTVGYLDTDGTPIESITGRNIETVPELNQIWSIGDRVEMRLTADSVNQIIDDATTQQQTASSILGTIDPATAINSYIVTLDPTVTTLVDGLRVYFTVPVGFENDGASTIKVDTTDAKPIVYYDGSVLEEGAILSGTTTGVIYNAAADEFILMEGGIAAAQIGNDGAGSGLDADLLDGYQETDFYRLARGTNIATGNVSYRSSSGVRGIYFNSPAGEFQGYLVRDFDNNNVGLLAYDKDAVTTGAYITLYDSGELILRARRGEQVHVAADSNGDVTLAVDGTGDILLAVNGTGKALYKNREISTFGAADYEVSATNGSYTFPGGFIQKWGRITTGGGNSGSVSFTTAFPTQCWGVQLTDYVPSSSGSVNYSLRTSLPSVSGFNWIGGTSATYIYWFAVGR